MSYFVKLFIESTEADFKFPLPVKELTQPEEDQDGKAETEVGREDRSLGEISVSLSAAWIREQLAAGKLPSVGLKNGDVDLPWSAFRNDIEEQHPDGIKSVVSPTDYEKVEVEHGRTFLMRKSMSVA